ncbi:MAG: M23 family metallopeptidase [Actinobacteria bacterium]|nr:M23 family metallopeptidase [Actinomycetota bacterium]
MDRRAPCRALVVATATATLLWGGAWTASAQLMGDGLLGGTTTTTTTTTTTAPPRKAPPATTTTTVAPPPQQSPPPSSGGESAPSPPTTPGSPPPPVPDGGPAPSPAMAPGPGAGAPAAPGAPGPGQAGGEPLPPAGDDGEVPPPDAGAFPAHLQALMDSVQRTGSNNTRALIAALAPLGEYGLSPEQAAVVGFGRFPIAGEATYSHDWWFPRFGPGWRLHQGTDIFADRGTPVRAPVDGSVRIRNGGLGGLSVYVTGADGTYYYLAHLAGIAPGLVDGARVTTGDVVGYVGDSGNARGGLPHVHFEVHPRGGGPVDPKPVLDQYIVNALEAADEVIAAYAEAAAKEGAGGGRPELSEPRDVDVRAVENLRGPLLWITSVNPSAGAMTFAQAEALRAGGDINWARAWVDQHAVESQRAQTARQVDAWLRPLVPPALAAAMG